MGIEETKTVHEIEKLKAKGDIYEAETDGYRST